MRKEVRFITVGAIIAAMYAVLTMAMWETSHGVFQFRLSEALCVLPAFTPAAIPGLTVGCIIANVAGGSWIDVVFGSLATLLASICTYFIGRAFRVGKKDGLGLPGTLLCPLPPVIFNAAIIPFVLYFGYGYTSTLGVEGVAPVIGLYAATVGAGEAAVCYVLGVPLMIFVNRYRKKTTLL